MALWQYTFFVLPEESLRLLNSDLVFERSQDGFDDAPYWKLMQKNSSFFKGIDYILKKAKSWSKNIDLYGNQESSCFEVLFDHYSNCVISVSFRIDFTSNYERILRGIIEFCILNGLVILDEDLILVPMNLEQVKQIIEHSPQVNKYEILSKKKDI